MVTSISSAAPAVLNVPAVEDAVAAEAAAKNAVTKKVVDEILDLLLAIDDKTSLKDLEEAVQKIETLIHHKHSEISKSVSKSHQDEREIRIQKVIDSYRGRSVLVLSLASSGCHFISGFTAIAPQLSHQGGEQVNRLAGWATNGRFKLLDGLLLDANKPEDLAKVSELFIKFFSSTASTMDNINSSIISPREQSSRMPDQSKSEDLLRMKDEENQTKSRETSREDESKRKSEQAEQKHHDAKMAILRG